MDTEKLYSITLADGTTLEDLRLNGNNFVSQVPIEESVFQDNLSVVTINDGETEALHENMELIHLAQYGDAYWFILEDISKEELARLQLRSDIDYLAMVTEVEL